MERIAVIGMGTSGMAVVAAYAKEVDTSRVQIDCYDTPESFGKGYPYRDDSDGLLLNLKTRKISYDYENNDDLAEWLQANGEPVNEYTSRRRFGLYTSARLAESMEKIGAQKITEPVVHLDWLPKEELWEVETDQRRVNRYDRVHFCVGELTQNAPFPLEEHDRYIDSVYPTTHKLAVIPEGSTVAVIGAGLTGVDVATGLLEERKAKKVYMFSRSCVIPTVRVDPVDRPLQVITVPRIQNLIDEGNGFSSFETFEELLREELQFQGIDFDQFQAKHMCGGIEGLRTNINEPDDLAIVQAILPPMNVALNKIWVALTASDRKRFRAKYHPFMTLNRSPLPQISAEQLIQAADEGRLEMPVGINGAKWVEEREVFEFSSGDEVIFTSEWACNATGLDTFMRKISDKNPLLTRMLDKRYLQMDDYGGVSVVPEDVSAISPRFGNMKTLHVHGVIISGVQYRNNSTLIMQMTAHNLIKDLYK